MDTKVEVFTVPAGPFRGLVATSTEIETRTDFDTGRTFRSWDTHARTRHFLDYFKPSDGYRIGITHAPSGLEMPDYSRSATGEEFSAVWIFTATLFDDKDREVNSGSAMQLMNCPLALEMGETRARSKLYTALGLPASPDFTPEEATPAPEKQKPPKVSVKAIPSYSTPSTSDPADSVSAAEPVSETATAQGAEAIVAIEQSESTDAPASQPESLAREDAVETPSDDASEAGDQSAEVEHADHNHDHEPTLTPVAVVPSPVSGQTKAQAKCNSIPLGLLRQIEQRAKKAGRTVPTFATLKDAQDYLAELINPGQPILDAGESS